ncbi:hypothetical protein, partial [Amycolatopsis anabasis]|uniref:WXG100-like domain-containing protein n=1 Tax=Amycolatopsis anabasis TaxID=1840409 RepID=UPI001C551443
EQQKGGGEQQKGGGEQQKGGGEQQKGGGEQQKGGGEQQKGGGEQAARKASGEQKSGDDFDSRVLAGSPMPVTDSGALRDTAKGWRDAGRSAQQAADEGQKAARGTEPDFRGTPGDQLRQNADKHAEMARSTGAVMNRLAGHADRAADVVDATKQVRQQDLDQGREIYDKIGALAPSEAEGRFAQEKLVQEAIARGQQTNQQGVQAMTNLGGQLNGEATVQNSNPAIQTKNINAAIQPARPLPPPDGGGRPELDADDLLDHVNRYGQGGALLVGGAGAAVGSVVPGAGTAAGAGVGAAAGGAIGGLTGVAVYLEKLEDAQEKWDEDHRPPPPDLTAGPAGPGGH